MLEVGARAPEFILANDQGGETSLSDLVQDGPLILYFYPADFTPGCTKEACSIRDIHSDIQSVGLQVAGVSPQDVDSHIRFRDEYELPFILLSDPEKTAIKMYDVDGPFGVGVRRATFLISQDRVIQDAVIGHEMKAPSQVQIPGHRQPLTRAVRVTIKVVVLCLLVKPNASPGPNVKFNNIEANVQAAIDDLTAQGITLIDKPGGVTEWHR